MCFTMVLGVTRGLLSVDERAPVATEVWRAGTHASLSRLISK